MSFTQRESNRSLSRKGVISAMALAVLVVVSLLVAQYIRRTVEDRRYSRSEIERAQTEYLAEAGLQIARSSLKKDQSWSGTQWELPKGTISKTKFGRVTISVTDGICTVIAVFPADTPTPVQVTRRQSIAELLQ